jgi:hypothetical protein
MPHSLHSPLARTVAFLLLALAVSLASGASCAAGASVGTEVQSSGNYLPLAVGNRWELHSRNASEPMVLEVTDREGDTFVVRWINPFIKATFRFRLDGARVLMTGLDMGQGNAPMPANTVYWDFGRSEGSRWNSPVGDGEISDRGSRVETPSGEYRDTVEVRTIDRDGQSMYWTFAADVGLVRWGRGRDAYLLSSRRSGPPSADRTPAAPPKRTPPAAGGSMPLIGMDATPHAKSGSGRRGKLAALRQLYDAGATLLHTAPTWNGFERSPGQFALSDDADAIGEFAEEFKLPLAVNLRIIDTNQRSMPKAYASWRFDDERMVERLRAAIKALPRSYKTQARIFAIGNEVNNYFDSRRSEILPYANLMRRVRDTVRTEFPNAQFTVNFTFSAAGNMDRYREITTITDLASFTYYPLNGDFTMRPPSDVPRDLSRMLDAADGKRVYIQEIGYASAERLRSSPAQQADFYERVFALTREHRDRIAGVTFLFMSDLPRSVVDTLGGYYKLANSENFKAYLQTLGALEQDGTPKPAWDVFRREAAAMKAGR